jgi:D-alanyl-D-alanine carboxypeptidase
MARAAEATTLPLPTTGPAVRKRAVLATSVVAPVAAGARLGVIEVSRGGSVIATVPVFAETAVARRPFPLAIGAAAQPAWRGLTGAWSEFWGIVARQAAFV